MEETKQAPLVETALNEAAGGYQEIQCPTIDMGLCIGCGNCPDECFAHAISHYQGTYRIEKALCVGCGRCLNHCPVDAIHY